MFFHIDKHQNFHIDKHQKAWTVISKIAQISHLQGLKQYFKNGVRHKFDFLYEDKHYSFLQDDNTVFYVHS